jgi:hypothetical protein
MNLKVLSWNLKFFPAVGGAVLLDEDINYMDSAAFLANEKELQDADTTKTPLDKGKLIDFERVSKLFEILKTNFPTGKDAPDVMLFQEVVSVNYLASIIAKYNSYLSTESTDQADKDKVCYPYFISTINDQAVVNQSQKLCIVSKSPIEEVERINVFDYFNAHKRPRTDSLGPANESETIKLIDYVENTRPELQQAIAGQPAWGKLLVNFEFNRSIRPILAAKILHQGSRIWVLNVHLKSNLPSPKALGLNSVDPSILTVLQAWNKTLREMTCSVVAGFIESKKKQFQEANSSGYGFLVGGDFNTTKKRNLTAPEFVGDASLNFFTSVLNPPMKFITEDYISFPNAYDQSKALDIDHMFWSDIEGSFSQSLDQSSFKVIDIYSPENTIKYEEYNPNEVQFYEQGKYYVIPGSVSGNKEGGTALFLCRKNSSSKGYSAGYIREGSLIKSLDTTVKIDSQESKEFRYAILTKVATKQGENHLGSLNGKCKVILLEGTKDEKRGTIKELFPDKNFTWEIKRTDIEGSIEQQPKAKFVKSDWEQIYPFWSPSVSKYNVGFKIVYKAEVYECLEVHESGGFNINDESYRNKYWKKIHTIDKSYISDHNGIVITLG